MTSPLECWFRTGNVSTCTEFDGGMTLHYEIYQERSKLRLKAYSASQPDIFDYISSTEQDVQNLFDMKRPQNQLHLPLTVSLARHLRAISFGDTQEKRVKIGLNRFFTLIKSAWELCKLEKYSPASESSVFQILSIARGRVVVCKELCKLGVCYHKRCLGSGCRTEDGVRAKKPNIDVAKGQKSADGRTLERSTKDKRPQLTYRWETVTFLIGSKIVYYLDDPSLQFSKEDPVSILNIPKVIAYGTEDDFERLKFNLVTNSWFTDICVSLENVPGLMRTLLDPGLSDQQRELKAQELRNCISGTFQDKRVIREVIEEQSISGERLYEFLLTEFANALGIEVDLSELETHGAQKLALGLLSSLSNSS